MSQETIIYNRKTSWIGFQIMGTLVGLFFVVIGIILMVTLLKDPHNEVLPVIIVTGFMIFMGLCLIGGVAGSIIYLKKKREKFIAAFLADDATKIFSDRDGAALKLWHLVKAFTQHLPFWSKLKPVYSRYWLDKYRNNLEDFR